MPESTKKDNCSAPAADMTCDIAPESAEVERTDGTVDLVTRDLRPARPLPAESPLDHGATEVLHTCDFQPGGPRDQANVDEAAPEGTCAFEPGAVPGRPDDASPGGTCEFAPEAASRQSDEAAAG